jgi:hypothetical protein
MKFELHGCCGMSMDEDFMDRGGEMSRLKG